MIKCVCPAEAAGRGLLETWSLYYCIKPNQNQLISLKTTVEQIPSNLVKIQTSCDILNITKDKIHNEKSTDIKLLLNKFNHC